MKEFITTAVKAETCVLVSLVTRQQNERKTNEYLDELEFLAETAGAVTVKRFTQKVDGPSAVTYVGSGKLQEIRAYIEECDRAVEEYEDALEELGIEHLDPSLRPEFGLAAEAPQPVGMVIFDDELSAKQLRNIERELKVKILDRMEALGIYEVAPEDFAVAEFVDSSKVELQRIVREGLDMLRKENE